MKGAAMITPEELAERMKAEILYDMSRGTVDFNGLRCFHAAHLRIIR